MLGGIRLGRAVSELLRRVELLSDPQINASPRLKISERGCLVKAKTYRRITHAVAINSSESGA